ncbi:uncharacterized protein RAG0_13165 [Rhynchosporium agropyri]|uniref:Uncharacterized protein n=1 Tax=Rhynchosporium agropyri TaxID=914238 RepID=A0A1E1LBU3_9HELO|nr:uncharacterized protein RAG0_13165 [Rhynchosporium agropyri]
MTYGPCDPNFLNTPYIALLYNLYLLNRYRSYINIKVCSVILIFGVSGLLYLGLIDFSISEERFYLRLLLMIVRGPKSFNKLYDFKGVTYETYKATYIIRGLAENN